MELLRSMRLGLFSFRAPPIPLGTFGTPYSDELTNSPTFCKGGKRPLPIPHVLFERSVFNQFSLLDI